MKATIPSLAALAAACIFIGSQSSTAQDNGWTGGVGGNWTDTTWQTFGPPDPSFDARGIIGSTVGSSSPVGAVDVTTSVSSPSVLLGDGAGTSGTLNIAPGGNLSVVSGDAGSTGVLSVGVNGGIGVLNVEGVLDVELLLESRNTGDGGNTIMLSGSANVTSVDGFLDRQLIIDGSNVSASFSNNLVLGSDGVHTWRIPATGPATVLVGGNADLGGTLRVEFPDGTPPVGSSWNLIDSSTVDSGDLSPSGFNNIDQSSVPGLGTGTNFAVRSVTDAASTHGTYSKLVLEQHPVLVVDRSTGAASMRNFSGAVATVDIQAYVIGSALGALNPAGWDSIDPANGWVEANPSSTTLSELNPTSSESIQASSSISLGTPVAFPTPSVFGEENEDITFQFGKTGETTFTEGRVIYTGVPNNTLTLNVDTNTGEAQIINGTNFAVSIQAYVISTEDGSLNFADGDPADTWNSLEDQATSGGNWYEANPSRDRISELLVVGGLELAPSGAINLGSPFDDVDGAQDLQFQFALVGNALGDSGDFNGDGARNGQDFLDWQRGNSPDPRSAEDLADWQQGFGTPVVSASELLTGKVLYSPLVVLGGGSASAVPEPGALGLLGACLALAFRATRRANSRSFQ